jgi:hypothetical protein
MRPRATGFKDCVLRAEDAVCEQLAVSNYRWACSGTASPPATQNSLPSGSAITNQVYVSDQNVQVHSILDNLGFVHSLQAQHNPIAKEWGVPTFTHVFNRAAERGSPEVRDDVQVRTVKC